MSVVISYVCAQQVGFCLLVGKKLNTTHSFFEFSVLLRCFCRLSAWRMFWFDHIGRWHEAWCVTAGCATVELVKRIRIGWPVIMIETKKIRIEWKKGTHWSKPVRGCAKGCKNRLEKENPTITSGEKWPGKRTWPKSIIPSCKDTPVSRWP